MKGEEIPIAAQVVALADVYDALTSKRVYKPAFSHEKAVDMILNGECGVFNPVLLTCLKELSETLEEELRQRSEGQNFQEEALDAVEHMMESGELDVSDRTLKLLEHERVKYQFFAELSQEIQFEYTTTPEMVILSEWGAKYLSMPETILNPKKDDFGTVLFAPKDFEDFLARLESTTPENPRRKVSDEYQRTYKVEQSGRALHVGVMGAAGIYGRDRKDCRHTRRAGEDGSAEAYCST